LSIVLSAVALAKEDLLPIADYRLLTDDFFFSASLRDIESEISFYKASTKSILN
jgi:hypothetical protein